MASLAVASHHRRVDDLEPLATLFARKRITVLTGAGCSTESGIPDYRGPGTTARAKNPIQWRDYAEKTETRNRYWARAMVGWDRFSGAVPNDAHRALARLERAGIVTGLITQNVDRLHQAAGSELVVELHGALAETRCTACGGREPRSEVQIRLREANPGFAGRDAELLPDGDTLLADGLADFRSPACLACGGVIRPDVVFFGENVARPIVDRAFALLEASDALLVVGTSLTVFSGFRFVRRAAERAIPIGIINLGPCRGEELATLRVDARAGVALPALATRLAAMALPPLDVQSA